MKHRRVRIRSSTVETDLPATNWAAARLAKPRLSALDVAKVAGAAEALPLLFVAVVDRE
jgi:hypothetical protein